MFLKGLAVIGDAGVEIGGEETAAGHLLFLGGINGRLDGHQAGIVDGARRQTGALIGIVGFVGDFQPLDLRDEIVDIFLGGITLSPVLFPRYSKILFHNHYFLRLFHIPVFPE